MFVTADQVYCHVIGDFFLQSDWQAANKYTRKEVALVHAVLYTLPFLALTRRPTALAVICLSHAIIDHYKLGNYVAWIKNWISPERPRPWAECKATGYDPDRPVWLTVWLSILTDNAMHIGINALALKYLGKAK